jgi:hypothetical protein
MRKSIGFLAWLDLVHFPTITDYWSETFVAANTMSRNWFELLLQMWWHSSNNKEYSPNVHKFSYTFISPQGLQ